MSHPRPRHAPSTAKPDSRLAAFLEATLTSARGGGIGKETAVDLIRAWPTMRADELALKSAALRQLATL
jgi:hypothetical protein